ncbi:hypothetical protein PHSY_006404 [Pseudozyma hubeiensis SY62]|uniref:Uncharacterized protein n=1 Tax=Pseudozyma hubeiensis (strain SY62) TaxID=1305764 RepID=R9PBT6_PSEHS|nr:hypothetical protein PHSY_006404 [Pseudozyma hubeiensis SY62]GAC98809.1 hypothetical protein PHSY_006404 [Pseudozyma hubeiensis SY62]
MQAAAKQHERRGDASSESKTKTDTCYRYRSSSRLFHVVAQSSPRFAPCSAVHRCKHFKSSSEIRLNVRQ